MDERGLAMVRAQLEDFAAVVFAGIPRSDQRATGVRYLRGLMLDGRRKSIQPMGDRLGIDYQQLQQFVTSSTWDVVGVRRRCALLAVEAVDPQVWVVDDTGFPKNGKASACVARQYSGTLGKVSNCQIAVSVHAASDAASAVLDWRLFVPQSWDDTCLPDPSAPSWCVVARPFVEWGDNLLSRLAQDPAPLKVGYAKWKLLDRYMRLYHRTTDEHRPETNQGAHPCLHEAPLLIWQQLEDVEMQAAIPELEPPRLQIVRASELHAQGAETADEPSLEELSGIIIGVEEDDQEDEGHPS